MLSRRRLLVSLIGLMILLSQGTPILASNQPAPITPDWMITRGGSQTDAGWGVSLDSQGAVYFAGHDTTQSVLSKIFLYKLNSSTGTQIWRASWGGSGDNEGLELITDNGTVYLGGRTQNQQYGTEDMVVLAFDSQSGVLKWATTWAYKAGAGYHEVDGIAVDGNSLYVAGWATVPSRSSEIGLLKLDRQTGRILWNSTWGSTGWDEANGDIVVDSSRIYVAGRYNASNILFGGSAVVASFDKSDGHMVKFVMWNDGGTSDYYSMTSDSRFLYTVGLSTLGGDNIVVQKFDKDLNLIWTSKWGAAAPNLLGR